MPAEWIRLSKRGSGSGETVSCETEIEAGTVGIEVEKSPGRESANALLFSSSFSVSRIRSAKKSKKTPRRMTKKNRAVKR